MTGKALTIGSVTESVGYGYTGGDLTGLVTPSGQTVVYSYNSNHQVTSISVNSVSVLTGVTYEPFGGVDGWTVPAITELGVFAARPDWPN